MYAGEYIVAVQEALYGKLLETHLVDWISISWQKYEDGDVMFLFTKLLKVSPYFRPGMVPVYSELFQKYRRRKEPVSDERCTALVDAFFKLHVDKRDIAGTLQRRILEYSEDFDPAIHFAPYTSLIDPTGVGKPYAVQLLAKNAGVYVVYCSLAGRRPKKYPEANSLMVDAVQRLEDERKATAFFECYIAINLLFVKLCKEFKISPGMFFDMQVKEDFAYETCDAVPDAF